MPDIKQGTEITEDKAVLVPLAEKIYALNRILSNVLSEISEIEQRLEL